MNDAPITQNKTVLNKGLPNGNLPNQLFNPKAFMPYLFILLTVLLTVYGQIMIKWRVGLLGGMPDDTPARVSYFVTFLFNPWVISSYMAAFLASVAWMFAVRQLPLSQAYPFTGLSFVLVLLSSALIFHELITLPKMVGVALIVFGIFVASRG